MTRLLVLLAILLCAAYLVSRSVARLRSRISELLIVPAEGRQRGEAELVGCAACGVHVPRSRALPATPRAGDRSARERFYCSESCERRMALRSQSGAA